MRRLLFACFFGVLIVGCSSCAGSIHHNPGYASDGARITAQASMRLVIYCGDEPVGVGSAVAVAPRYAITARHVVSACEDEGLAGETVVALLPDGRSVPMVEDARAKDPSVDAARLVATGTSDAFFVYARARASRPRSDRACAPTPRGHRTTGLR